MSLSKLYAAEFKQGGKKSCERCSRQSHGALCSFCLKDDLLGAGVKKRTLQLCSAVFRVGNKARFKLAIDVLDLEISK